MADKEKICKEGEVIGAFDENSRRIACLNGENSSKNGWSPARCSPTTDLMTQGLRALVGGELKIPERAVGVDKLLDGKVAACDLKGAPIKP